MSVASSLNSSLSRSDLKKNRSSTADAIFEKEFKEKTKQDAPLKCKLETNFCDSCSLICAILDQS